jgi:hypothetical protein
MKNSIFLSIADRVEKISDNQCEQISMIRNQIEKIMKYCVVQFMISNAIVLIHVEYLSNIQIDNFIVDVISTYLFSNVEELVSDSTDDEARDSCDCRYDDETRNEVFDDRKNDVSIMIKMKKKFDLRIRRSSDEDDSMIRESD